VKKTQWMLAAELDSYKIACNDRCLNSIILLPSDTMYGHNLKHFINRVDQILITASASLCRVPCFTGKHHMQCMDESKEV
jgi:hypothetical protein